MRKKSFFLQENTEGDILSLNRNSCSEEKSFLLPLIQDGEFWLKGKMHEGKAETHRLSRGGVGDVIFPGRQRQGCLIELHKDRKRWLASAAFYAAVFQNSSKRFQIHYIQVKLSWIHNNSPGFETLICSHDRLAFKFWLYVQKYCSYSLLNVIIWHSVVSFNKNSLCMYTSFL